MTSKQISNHRQHLIVTFLHVGTFLVALHSQFSTEAPEIEHKEWPRSRSRNVSDYINFQVDTDLIRPDAFEQPCKNGLLWIFVVSAPQNFRQREIARSSWLNQTIFGYDAFKTMHAGLEGTYLDPLDTNREVQFTFLLGRTKDPAVQRKINEEGLMHGDILQEDIEDSYGNLVLKSILALKWASHQKCIRKYKYIAKLDDNNFINVPNLIQILAGGSVPTYRSVMHYYSYETVQVRDESIRLKHPLILGQHHPLRYPIRRADSKYHCPKYIYKKALYPTFSVGWFYLIRQDITKALLQASLTTPLLPLEDVYITGMLPEVCGFQSTHTHLSTLLPLPADVCGRRGSIAENLRNHFERLPSIVNSVLDSEIKCEHIDTELYKYIYYAMDLLKLVAAEPIGVFGKLYALFYC